MLNYIYEALRTFRKVFSRHGSWLLFVALVLGFIGSAEIVGVTSFCRFWLLDEKGYYTLLRFFRSTSWSLPRLIHQWHLFVLSQHETITVEGRVILLGDHTHVPKDGRRMPGVVTMRQDSETQSKPSYFRGQCWGAIGLLIGSMELAFCLPLRLEIHQGLEHIAQERSKKSKKSKRSTLAERIILMALEFAVAHDLPSILILDAFFPTATVFKLANSIWSVSLKAPLVTIIVRAKKNYVAYYPAETNQKGKRGRPKKYGQKIKLMECFDHSHLFHQVTCRVYGKTENISIMAQDLLWRPTGEMVRFVFARTSRCSIVLMCSDLNQDPVLALRLYCSRVRIETMFDVLKNLLNAFHFRFWSKKMPKTSRKPTKNKERKLPDPQALKTVTLCWQAYECFVLLAIIAQGLLQMIALKYSDSVWKQSFAFLRTKSRELPSEKTVKQLIAPLLGQNFLNLASGGIMREIRQRFFGGNSIPQHLMEEHDSQREAA